MLLLNHTKHMCVNNSCTVDSCTFLSMDMNSLIDVIRVSDLLA